MRNILFASIDILTQLTLNIITCLTTLSFQKQIKKFAFLLSSKKIKLLLGDQQTKRSDDQHCSDKR